MVIADELEPVLADLRAADFRVREFPFSINAQRRAGPGGRASHQLMVQFTRPERYQGFVARAVLRPIFGVDVPVAALSDLVQGKLWDLVNSAARASARAKDRFDLLRLAEAHPDEVEPLPPDKLRARSIANREHPTDDGWGGDDRPDDG